MIGLAIALCVGGDFAAAQDRSAKLDTVLARVNFDGPEKVELLGPALADLSADDLARLCDLLVEPGTGDDTRPRMALEGLTWYLGGRAPGEERTRYIQALCKALDSDKPAPVKSFLTQQLQLIADETAVPTLAKFLRDDDLYDFAAQALLAIGGDPAAGAFLDAYAQTKGPQRIAIMQALGALRDGRAAESLLPLSVAAEDSAERRAARTALADIGVNPTFKPLKATDEWYDQSQEWALLFRFIEGMRVKDAPVDVTATLGVLLKSNATQRLFGQTALLYELARADGPKAVPDVVAAMASDDRESAGGATEIAVTIGGPQATDAFVGELKQATPPVRAMLLSVLARRADSAALPAVLAALKDEDKSVRLAAISAARALGREDAIKSLVAAFDTDQDDEREAVRQALWRIPGSTAAGKIAAALNGAPPRVRISLLEALADRRAQDQLDAIYGHTTDTDEAVRIAAIRAVEKLADERAAPRLLSLLAKAKSDAERTALEHALAATCNRAASAAQRASPIVAALHPDNPSDYASLLRVLGHIGGPDALNSVRKALEDEREDIRAVAFTALLDWPDPAAADDVLRIAKDTQEVKHHVLALRAYTRLVALDKTRPPRQMLDMYQAGMQATRRPEEQRLLLAKLGEVHDAQTLPILEPYLADAALQDEAAAAMLSVADGLLPAGWPAARAAIDKVLSMSRTDSLRKRAEELAQRVAELEDYITAWRVAGPYTQAGKNGEQLFDVPFPPEEPGAPSVEWQAQPVTTDPGRHWYVNLQATPSIAGNDRAAYLATRVYSPKAQDVLLEAGSDDGIKIWLNAQAIHANNVPRGCERGQDKVRATLKEGWNDLLLKVVNGGGAWAACLRVRRPGGEHVDGLRADPEGRP